MNTLQEYGIQTAFHYAPLHYLVFFTRTGTLFSKLELKRLGFADTHFRSSSRRQDEIRGFAKYVHMMLQPFPPIVEAKLKRGFPHFSVEVPVNTLSDSGFDLCRYNVAKSRYLRRPGSAGVKPGRERGYYHDGMQIPIARGKLQQRDLLKANLSKVSIELLIPNRLALPLETRFCFYHPDDLHLATELMRGRSDWECHLAPMSQQYQPAENHRQSVSSFIAQCVADPHWLGNGLEYDRL